MPKTILVSGGAGYIGSHMVRYMLKAGYAPVVLDNLVYGHKEALPAEVPLYVGDIGDRALVKKICRDHHVTAAMHFSAYAYVGESVTDPAKYYDNNFVKTLAFLNALRESGVDYFIFSSTCATYGATDQASLSEAHPQNPINPYGMTKLMVEKALADYARAYGFKYVALRYFNAAGADDTGEIGESHEPETHLIPLALRTLYKDTSLQLFGTDYPTPDGTCVRDYIHVNDLADAHLRALEYLFKTKTSNFFNLGSENGYSVREIIAMCEKVSGKKVRYTEAPRRPGDPPVLVADATKAREVLGWKTQYSLEKIISTAWAWEQKKRY